MIEHNFVSYKGFHFIDDFTHDGMHSQRFALATTRRRTHKWSSKRKTASTDGTWSLELQSSTIPMQVSISLRCSLQNWGLTMHIKSCYNRAKPLSLRESGIWRCKLRRGKRVSARAVLCSVLSVTFFAMCSQELQFNHAYKSEYFLRCDCGTTGNIDHANNISKNTLCSWFLQVIF